MIKVEMARCTFDGDEDIIRAEIGTLVSAYRNSLIRRHGFSSRKATENVSRLLVDALVISETYEGEEKIVQFKKKGS